MVVRMLLAIALVLCGCVSNPMDPDNRELSNMLSLSNRVKRPIQDPANPSQIIALQVEVDIINVGDLTITVPFTITWSLLDGQGKIYGSASRRLEGNMAPGAKRHVSLTLNFPATPSLEGFSDAVTFDLVT